MARWIAETRRWEWDEGELEGQVAASLAAERGRGEGDAEPCAVAIRFEHSARRYVIELTNGATFVAPADLCQYLEGAADEALADVVIRPGGHDLHWPQLDQDLSIASLLIGR